MIQLLLQQQRSSPIIQCPSSCDWKLLVLLCFRALHDQAAPVFPHGVNRDNEPGPLHEDAASYHMRVFVLHPSVQTCYRLHISATGGFRWNFFRLSPIFQYQWPREKVLETRDPAASVAAKHVLLMQRQWPSILTCMMFSSEPIYKRVSVQFQHNSVTLEWPGPRCHSNHYFPCREIWPLPHELCSVINKRKKRDNGSSLGL